MSRKNFIALAAAIKNLRETHGENIPAVAMVNAISGVCIEQSENFQLRRFEAACEPALTGYQKEQATLREHAQAIAANR